MGQQFISRIEAINIVDRDTILLDIKGLDLSVLPNRSFDRNMIRRVRLKNVERDERYAKYIMILDIQDIDFYIQIPRSIFLKLSKIIEDVKRRLENPSPRQQ